MSRAAIGGINDSLGPDFSDFVAAMNAHAVDFVLVGVYAVGVYGVVRATSDIDFLYRCSADNVARLCHALAEFGAPEIVIDPVALLNPDTVSAFGSPPHRIDLLASISGVDFEMVWQGAQRITIGDLTLRVIGLAELRQNKSATGRAKDKSDLRLLPKPKSD